MFAQLTDECHRQADSDELKKIIQSADNLPTIPVIASRVLAMLRNEEVRIEELASVVLTDPSVAAKVMRMANSPYYGWRRNIRTIPEAIAVLGFNTLKGLVMTASLFQIYKPFGVVEKLLWEHSCAVGMSAKLLASVTIPSLMEETFLVGLLHDIGKLVLNAYSPVKFDNVVTLNKYLKIGFNEAERKVFCCSHGEIGGFIIEKWNFPEELIVPVRNHHCFNSLVTEDKVFSYLTEESFPIFLTAIVGLADQFCLKLGIGYQSPVDIEPANSPQAAYLGIDYEKSQKLLVMFHELYTKEWVDMVLGD